MGIRNTAVSLGDAGPEIRAAVGDGGRWGAEIAYLEQSVTAAMGSWQVAAVSGARWLPPVLPTGGQQIRHATSR